MMRCDEISNIVFQVSFMCRMIPSPDWFVGVDSLNMCIDSTWVDQISMDVSIISSRYIKYSFSGLACLGSDAYQNTRLYTKTPTANKVLLEDSLRTYASVLQNLKRKDKLSVSEQSQQIMADAAIGSATRSLAPHITKHHVISVGTTRRWCRKWFDLHSAALGEFTPRRSLQAYAAEACSPRCWLLLPEPERTSCYC